MNDGAVGRGQQVLHKHFGVFVLFGLVVARPLVHARTIEVAADAVAAEHGHAFDAQPVVAQPPREKVGDEYVHAYDEEYEEHEAHHDAHCFGGRRRTRVVLEARVALDRVDQRLLKLYYHFSIYIYMIIWF